MVMKSELENSTGEFSKLIWGAKLVSITHAGNEVLCEMENGEVLCIVAGGAKLVINFPEKLALPVPVGDWAINGNTACCYAEDKELYFQIYPEGETPFATLSPHVANIYFMKRKTDAAV